MKKLNIEITKAQLVSFSVTAKEGKPEVSVTLALLTEGGKTITTYSCQTNSWDDSKELDLPVNSLPLIGDLARMLEAAAVRNCRDSQLALPDPAMSQSFAGGPDVVTSVEIVNAKEDPQFSAGAEVTVVSEEPIDLSDFGF